MSLAIYGQALGRSLPLEKERQSWGLLMTWVEVSSRLSSASRAVGSLAMTLRSELRYIGIVLLHKKEISRGLRPVITLGAIPRQSSLPIVILQRRGVI